MSALDAAQSPENPFAVWTIFHGIHRWYFARGCPPTVRSDRGWVQGLRLSILLGVMGVVSGWLSTLIGRIPSPVLFTFPTLDSAPGMVSVSSFAMGATYGLLVLMPLSRWLGRPWMMAVASVPVSSATFVLAMWVALRHLQSETYDSLMVAGAVGGGVLAVWMIPSFRFRTGWLIALAALVGGGCG
ncbi:MAG: hypothetical protein SH850_15955, partial [Planctomycetaceae bacterium]|nr:hypothetical protein [Planctomycetaceae bacterium]